MIDPMTIGLMEDDIVLFMSDPLDGDKFIVLREGQSVFGALTFTYYVETLDWTCYESPPKVIRL